MMFHLFSSGAGSRFRINNVPTSLETEDIMHFCYTTVDALIYGPSEVSVMNRLELCLCLPFEKTIPDKSIGFHTFFEDPENLDMDDPRCKYENVLFTKYLIFVTLVPLIAVICLFSSQIFFLGEIWTN